MKFIETVVGHLWKIMAVAALALGAAYYFLLTQIVPGLLQEALPQLESLAPRFINGSVTVAALRWPGGLSAEIDGVQIRDAQGVLLAELPHTTVHLRPWLALGTPARAVSRVVLQQPKAYLVMDEQNVWNMADLLKPSDSEETPFYGLLEVQEGLLSVATPYGSWSYGVNAGVNGGANPDFAVEAKITPLTASGAVKDKESVFLQGKLTNKGEGRLSVKAERLPLASYSPLAEHYAQIKALQGELRALHLLYSNKAGQHAYSGEAELAAAGGCYEAGGHVYTALVSGRVKAADSIVSTKGLTLEVDGQKIALEAEVDARDINDVSGSVLAQAASFEYDGFAAQDIRLPLTFTKELVRASAVSLRYGGGTVQGSLTLLPASKELAADISLRSVKQELPGRPEDTLSLNGVAALHLRPKNTDGSGEFTVEAAAETLQIGWRSLLLDHLTLDGTWDGERLTIAHLGAQGGDGRLALSGSVEADGRLDLKGRMAEFPIHPFLDFAGHQGTGYASAGFEVGGSFRAPEFSGMVQLAKAEIMQQQIEEAHGFFGLRDNVLTIKKFSAHMAQGEHLVDGSVDLRGAEPVLNLALETKRVRMEPLMLAAGLQEKARLTGNFDNVMQVTGPLSALHVEGEACLSDGSVQGYLLDKVQGRYLYDSGALRLKSVLITALGARLSLKGLMAMDGSLDFALDAKDVSLKRLPIMDSDVALDGLINASGHLGGTLEQPYFVGDISGDSISVNGETLTGLRGTLKSNGSDINELAAEFRQPYEGESSDYGLYQANLRLDIPNRDLRGNIVVLWGNVGGLLRLCQQDYSIDGTLTGEIRVNQEGRNSGIVLDGRVENMQIHDLRYYGMKFQGRLQNRVLYLENVKLQENKDDATKGVLTVGGSVNLRTGELDLALQTAQANPAIVTAVMTDPPEITGQMDLKVQLAGTLDEPYGSAGLHIRDGSVAGVGLDTLDASLTIGGDHIKLEKLAVMKNIYSVQASGLIPLDLFRNRSERRNPEAQMDIAVNLDEARLGILPALTQWVEWGVGDTKGQLKISGTLEEPLLYGDIKISDGSVKVKHLATVIDKINTDIAFDGNKILLNDMSAVLGRGKIAMDGSYAWRTTAAETYRLHIAAENTELASEIFSGRINSEIEIIPQRYPDFSSKTAAGEPVMRYRPLLRGGVRLDDVLMNITDVPEMGESGGSYGLDLTLELGPKIHMLNPYLYDIWLKGGLEIKGSTARPNISGNIKADKGTITYLRTPFKLHEATLAWINQGSFLPNVTLDSEARFSRYRIAMKINGPVDTMDLQLTSDPPQEKNTIVRMLTLQRDSEGSGDVTSEDMTNLMTAGLQMTVLGDVEMLVKQTLGLDQFRIYTGKARSGIGFESYKDRNQELTDDERKNYNVLVSKYLTPATLIGYTTSFDGENRAIFGQLDISRHFNLTYSRKYEELSVGPENWYGLEYKISF